MPRPDRPWIKNSYTVSPEVDSAIRTRAASLGVDTGTAVDAIIWEALLKPTETQMQAGGFSDDQLERMFAEDALRLLGTEEAIRQLADHLELVERPGANLRMIRALVTRWRKLRRIDKEHQEFLLSYFADGEWVPGILKHELVTVDWFQA